MKNISSAIVLFTALLVSCRCLEAQTWRTAKYDTAWLPITKKQLQSGIRRDANDATALFQWWRRARYQKLAQVAFDTFRAIKNEQPQNGAALAMYCMAIEQRETDEGKPRFQASPQELKAESRRDAIEKAQKLNPKVWLAYAAQGRFEYNTTVFDVDDQVRIYEKALSLSPNIAFTNVDYADALKNQSLQQKKSFQTAIAYIKRAQRLPPISSESSLDLIMTYRYRVPDRTKEKQAAQDYLATIPPNLSLTPQRRKWLAQWGVKVPW